MHVGVCTCLWGLGRRKRGENSDFRFRQSPFWNSLLLKLRQGCWPEVSKTLLSASHLHPQHWYCKQVPGHAWLFTWETEIQTHVPCFHGKYSYLISNHPSQTSFNQKYIVNGFLQLFMVLVLKCIAKFGILPKIDSTGFWYKIWKSIKAHYYKLCMYCGVICHH